VGFSIFIELQTILAPVAQLDICLPCLPAGRWQAGSIYLKDMYTVYSLKSEQDGRIYVGITGNIGQRIKEHNAGKSKSTKGYRPWALLYSQNVNNRIEA